jgi:hypothetical protein
LFKVEENSPRMRSKGNKEKNTCYGDLIRNLVGAERWQKKKKVLMMLGLFFKKKIIKKSS